MKVVTAHAVKLERVIETFTPRHPCISILARVLFAFTKEDIVGSVRNKGLIAHISGSRATGSWSHPAFRIQALDESSSGQEVTPRWSFVRTDDIQQQTRN